MLGSVHLSSLLLVSLLVLPTHVLRAQSTSIPEKNAVRLPDAPSRVAAVLEAQPHLPLSYKGFPLRQNPGQTVSWMRFFSDEAGRNRWSINSSAVLNPGRETAESLGKNKYFMGNAPTKWMTFAPNFGNVHHETIHGANDLEYFGHHMPWAGPVILRLSQQAKAHPHIATVIKAVHPKF